MKTSQPSKASAEGRKRVVVVGAGGHARSVCDILLATGAFEIVGLLDPGAGEGFFDIPVLGGDALLPELIRSDRELGAFVALGDNRLREEKTRELERLGYGVVNAVSPHAVVSPHAKLGRGIAIMPGAIVNACADIGDGCVLNTNCSIDHDTLVGAFTHIAPGATLCGRVTVGRRCFIGAGATVIDTLQLGDDLVLGAGATAIRSLPGGHTAVGVPARILPGRDGRGTI